MKTTQRVVRLTSQASTAEIRVQKYRGEDHLVVPVVALRGDSVVEGVVAEGPEFVPASVLRAAPGGWNGRPVVWDHPGGGKLLANESPQIKELYSFGEVFYTKYEDGKLLTEAFLSRSMAEEIGPRAVSVIEAVEAAAAGTGPMVEVSTAALVLMERRDGVAPDGTPYEFVWVYVIPDHLAIGLSGKPGACSVEDGCGAPRSSAARTAVLSVNNDDKEAEMNFLPRRLAEALGRLGPLAMMRAQQDSLGDDEVRGALWRALESEVPAFDYIVRVYPEESHVIYATWPPGEPVKLWRRGYSLDGDEASLADDAVEVEMIEEYVPVTNESSEPVDVKPQPVAQTDCTCNNGGGTVAQREGSTVKKTNPLVDRLIAAKATPFSEDDRQYLTSLGEVALSALAEAADPDSETDDDGDDTVEREAASGGASEADEEEEEEAEVSENAAGKTVPVPEETFLRLKEAADAYHAGQAAARKALVKKLAANRRVTSIYGEPELRAMAIGQLEKLAAVTLEEPDFSSRGLSELLDDEDSLESHMPPQPYDSVINSRSRAASTKEN